MTLLAHAMATIKSSAAKLLHVLRACARDADGKKYVPRRDLLIEECLDVH